MKTIKAFTWGYCGWGSESQHFVRAADWVEKKRGFLPPVFVDLRRARGGRAANFKGKTFGDIVGSRRYVWMPKLGNERIKSKKGKAIQIAVPSAAKVLLQLIIDKAKTRQRVVMFCACAEPILKLDDGMPSCHRVEVASLLLKEARKRGLQLEMSEWPGESPISIRVKTSESQKRALVSKARYIPVGSVNANIPALGALGWGSKVRFESSDDNWAVVAGPAPVANKQWRIQVFHKGRFNAREFTRQRGEDLLKAGYGPRSTRR